MLGCGQIKPHADGTRELASIAVWPRFQGQGVARAVIEHLLARHQPPLYLTCRAELQPFYQKFRFVTISESQATPYFRRLMRLARLLSRLAQRLGAMAVMRLD